MNRRGWRSRVIHPWGGERRWHGRVGRYRLADEIGRGAHGTVWRAWDGRERRWVAVKVFSARGGEEGAWRFLREQRIALRHPGIVEVLDFASDSRGSYLVTELCPAGTIEDRLTEHGPPAVDLALHWSFQLLDALAALRAADFVHRDIKAANLLLRQEDPLPGLVVADFGSARVGSVPLTRHPGPVGTGRSAAPEVLAGQPATPASDVWAAGRVVVRLLDGRHEDGTVDDARLGELVRTLVAAEPADRPTARAAATTFREVIARRAASRVVPSGRVTLPSRLKEPPPDPRLRTKVAVVAVAAVLANAIALWALTRPPTPPAPEPAAAGAVAWPAPSLTSAMAVADDGTIYLADAEQGVVSRVDGLDLVPVAGGGPPGTTRGAALDLDLRGPPVAAAAQEARPMVDGTPVRWTLAVGADGALWVNTGDIWRVEPGGEGRRVLRATDEMRPYHVVSLVPGVSLGEESMPPVTDLDDRVRYLASVPSPLQPRGDGVDVADLTTGRIVHVGADGGTATVCEPPGGTVAGPAATPFERPDADGSGLVESWRSAVVGPTGRAMEPDVAHPVATSSFAVVGAGHCWLVDAGTGAVVEVEDGALVTTSWYSAERRSWTSTGSDAAAVDAWSGSGRTRIVGRSSDGSVLLTAFGAAGGGALGTIVPGGVPEWLANANGVGLDFIAPTVTWRCVGGTSAPCDAMEIVGPSGFVRGADVSALALSSSGATAAIGVQLFDGLQGIVDGPTEALLDGDADADLVPAAPDARLLLGPSLEQGAVVSRATPILDAIGGLPAEQLRLSPGAGPYDLVVADDGAVLSAREVTWAVAGLPPRSGPLGGCSSPPYAADPSRSDLMVGVCWNGDESFVVDVPIGDPASTSTVTSREPLPEDANGDWKLSVATDGAVQLAAPDDGVVFALEDGDLVPVVGARAEGHRYPSGAAAHDPVRARTEAEDQARATEGTPEDLCSTEQTAPGPVAFLASAALPDGRTLVALEACLVVIAPGGAIARVDTGAAPEWGLEALAVVDDTHVAAHAPSRGEVWRIDLDGGRAELLAGRRGARGASPDGARAAGSPIGGVRALAVGPDGRPCWVEALSEAVRCVDERGALRTLVGPRRAGA